MAASRSAADEKRSLLGIRYPSRRRKFLKVTDECSDDAQHFSHRFEAMRACRHWHEISNSYRTGARAKSGCQDIGVSRIAARAAVRLVRRSRKEATGVRGQGWLRRPTVLRSAEGTATQWRRRGTPVLLYGRCQSRRSPRFVDTPCGWHSGAHSCLSPFSPRDCACGDPCNPALCGAKASSCSASRSLAGQSRAMSTNAYVRLRFLDPLADWSGAAGGLATASARRC